MKTSMYVIALFSAVTLCQAQEKVTKETIKSSTKNPDVTITVKKAYDTKGNLVSVDSSYNYVYSNVKKDPALEKDLYNKFKSNFNMHFNSLDSILKDDKNLDDPFKMNDFYTNEFFQNNFDKNTDFQTVIKKMDSIKNSFYTNLNKKFEENSKKKKNI